MASTTTRRIETTPVQLRIPNDRLARLDHYIQLVNMSRSAGFVAALDLFLTEVEEASRG